MKSDSTASDTQRTLRADQGNWPITQIWQALAQTPGVGISITDAVGRLIFVNKTTLVLFSGSAEIDYAGRFISDFHPPAFVEERLALIGRVLAENKPLALHHIYHGHYISSTVWPIRDKQPPFDRVLVVSQPGPTFAMDGLGADTIETVSTKYIDLGALDVLSRRELEVVVLLGHGLMVKDIAAVLHRSPKTIEGHKEAINRKLSTHSQVELVQMVTMMGLSLSDVSLERFELANNDQTPTEK